MELRRCKICLHSAALYHRQLCCDIFCSAAGCQRSVTMRTEAEAARVWNYANRPDPKGKSERHGPASG